MRWPRRHRPAAAESVSLDAPRRGPVTLAREVIGRKALERFTASPAAPIICAVAVAVVFAAVFAGALVATLMQGDEL